MTSIFFIYKLYSTKVKALSLSRSKKKDETEWSLSKDYEGRHWNTLKPVFLYKILKWAGSKWFSMDKQSMDGSTFKKVERIKSFNIYVVVV